MSSPWTRAKVHAVLTLYKWTGNDPERPRIPTDWVNYRELRDEIARVVPPGYALRRFNEGRETVYRRVNKLRKDEEVPPLSIEEWPYERRIKTGQIDIARRVLNQLGFEKDSANKDDPNRKIRLIKNPRILRRDMPKKVTPPRHIEDRLVTASEYEGAVADLATVQDAVAHLSRLVEDYQQGHPEVIAG